MLVMKTAEPLSKKAAAFVVICCVLFFFVHEGHAWFTSGQDADTVLSSPGFNNAGYLTTPGDGLLFNHPMNISTDGTSLLLADTRNNRVLIWNTLPTGNVSPDIVLGQDNFTTNNQGNTLNRLNWPVGVSAAKGKVVVSDTYNHRILIWNSFPTSNGQPADLYINNLPAVDPQRGFDGSWPWGVWTDGTKIVLCVTQASQVWIWNTFPESNNKAPDLVLNGKSPTDGTSSFGTPRAISTDGKTYLHIADHNAFHQNTCFSFIWRSFPSANDQPYDFFMSNPQGTDAKMGSLEKTSDGKFVGLTPPGISIWNSLPSGSSDPGALFVGRNTINDSDDSCTNDGYHFNDGDGSQLVIIPSGRVYISLANGNKVVGYNSLPTRTNQCPDFVIGAPDIQSNTYYASFLSNPMPATNGTSLFASELVYKLHVWHTIPTKDDTKPDFTYDLRGLMLSRDFMPSHNALYGTTFVLSGFGDGAQQVLIWKSLPLNGNQPDVIFQKRIGSINFTNISGLALDDKYLYIADSGKVYVWSALPDADTPPLFFLNLPQVGKIHSDGQYLAVVDQNRGTVKLYQVSLLSSTSTPVAELPASGSSYRFASAGCPSAVLIEKNHLFISDNTAGRVLAWRSVDDAIAGKDPDTVLGQPDLHQGLTVGITPKKLFWPVGLAFDGTRLWVGEFKFSSRLVGFNVGPSDDLQSISLLPGWNFISFPKTPPNPDIAAALKDISLNVRVVWGYDNGSKTWLKYKPDTQYPTLKTVEVGKGYWIYMDASANVDMLGWTSPSLTTFRLYEGWNLLGYAGTDSRDVLTASNSISGKWSIVWNWINGQWLAKHSDPSVALSVLPLATFGQGKAYWIKAKPGQTADWRQ